MEPGAIEDKLTYVAAFDSQRLLAIKFTCGSGSIITFFVMESAVPTFGVIFNLTATVSLIVTSVMIVFPLISYVPLPSRSHHHEAIAVSCSEEDATKVVWFP